MPEPTTAAAAVATLASATAVVPVLTAFGVPLGLRADLLMAGFSGSLVAIILLSTVPSTGDTWREMARTALRRMMVALASSLTAGYLTPMALQMGNVPESMLLGGAFAVGGGAQQVLMFAIRGMGSFFTRPPAGGEAP